MSSTVKARDELSGILVSLLSKVPGVLITKKLHSTNATINKKVFAFTKQKAVVLKLPPETCQRLVKGGIASFLIMGKRTMKEWVVIQHENHNQFRKELALFKEAIEFVAAGSPEP